MQYRTLGNTGVSVSEIAFGTGGNAGLMIQGTFEEQVQAAAHAIELGINYFDESPDYGSGVSESNLGKVLKELGVRPLINTKVEVRSEDLDDIAGHVERSVEASLERLGVDCVDVVQIHNGPVANRPELKGRQYNILWIEDYLRSKGALEGLQRVQRAGMTRFIGFICRGNDGAQVRRLIDTGCFNLINLIYTLMNPSASAREIPGFRPDPDWGGVIDYAAAHGVGVAIYSPLGGGVLTDTILHDRSAHRLSHVARRDTEWYQGNVRRAKALGFLSKPGRTLAQASTRFILDHPGVTTVLGGFSGIEHIDEAVPASGAPSLTAEEMARIEMVWRGNFGGILTPAGRGR